MAGRGGSSTIAGHRTRMKCIARRRFGWSVYRPQMCTGFCGQSSGDRADRRAKHKLACQGAGVSSRRPSNQVIRTETSLGGPCQHGSQTSARMGRGSCCALTCGRRPEAQARPAAEEPGMCPPAHSHFHGAETAMFGIKREGEGERKRERERGGGRGRKKSFCSMILEHRI